MKTEIKNIMIIGDSYSTFRGYIPEGYAVYYDENSGTDVFKVENTWWHRFVSETGVNLVLNDSWSGSTVCYTGRQSPEYGYRSSFVNRMHLMIKENFFKENKIDTVFVFGGTNDSWLDTTPKGEVQLSDWKEEDLYSTLPAICYMAATLKKELPEGNVVFIINTDLQPKISEAIKLACDTFGASYVELENIDKTSGHPTTLGMEQIKDQLRRALGLSSTESPYCKKLQ